MPHRLILKVTKFQLPPPKRLGTVVKNILGGHHASPPMSNRVKAWFSCNRNCCNRKQVQAYSEKIGIQVLQLICSLCAWICMLTITDNYGIREPDRAINPYSVWAIFKTLHYGGTLWPPCNFAVS